MNLSKDLRAFSLMESVVVAIIISVLAALAIPRYNFTIERTRSAEGIKVLAAVLTAQKAYQLEEGSYATSLSSLDVSFDSIENFSAPDVFDPADPVADPIATIDRSGGSYTYSFEINENGTVTCTNDVTACSKLGY